MLKRWIAFRNVKRMLEFCDLHALWYWHSSFIFVLSGFEFTSTLLPSIFVGWTFLNHNCPSKSTKEHKTDKSKLTLCSTLLVVLFKNYWTSILCHAARMWMKPMPFDKCKRETNQKHSQTAINCNMRNFIIIPGFRYFSNQIKLSVCREDLHSTWNSLSTYYRALHKTQFADNAEQSISNTF